ncbi:urate oxidase [Kribbella qitaiheensis]|uniref:Uricase n=1 Tax=Kribbella qitaiheensis TaxID=1544730 RepID=A0A7G6WS34_9ACTN|nr:urate oxidase [Kribbella qitaiheensis]QNE16799.1 urate oxidase [Kribbella qitaiheensis]
MAIHLGANQYGKAESRVVRIYRDTPRHQIRDLNVSSALRGRFENAHTTGDQSDVLPTDSQKNTAFAFAKEKGVGAIEEFALTLGDHFLEASSAADGARVEIEEYEWERISVDGAGHDHSFVRGGSGIRTTVVNVEGRGDDRRAHVVSGIRDLTVLKSTGSEFHGFLKDKYTTLPETDDRILATSLVARWRYDHTDVDWDKSYDEIKGLLLEQFARIHSLALQQTLYGMGEAVLERHPEVAEIKFSAPNKHHFLVDLSPFDVENPGEVFIAADRPYGLIEATVVRDDATDAGSAWHAVPGFC